eukprot:361557-Chlamydomonas_euryale.AAC.5
MHAYVHACVVACACQCPRAALHPPYPQPCTFCCAQAVTGGASSGSPMPTASLHPCLADSHAVRCLLVALRLCWRPACEHPCCPPACYRRALHDLRARHGRSGATASARRAPPSPPPRLRPGRRHRHRDRCRCRLRQQLPQRPNLRRPLRLRQWGLPSSRQPPRLAAADPSLAHSTRRRRRLRRCSVLARRLARRHPRRPASRAWTPARQPQAHRRLPLSVPRLPVCVAARASQRSCARPAAAAAAHSRKGAAARTRRSCRARARGTIASSTCARRRRQRAGRHRGSGLRG